VIRDGTSALETVIDRDERNVLENEIAHDETKVLETAFSPCGEDEVGRSHIADDEDASQIPQSQESSDQSCGQVSELPTLDLTY
jgi:hypothetical protein